MDKSSSGISPSAVPWPRAPVEVCCGSTLAQTGLALQSSVERAAGLALRCLCMHHLGLLLLFCATVKWLHTQPVSEMCTELCVMCTCTVSSRTGNSRVIQSDVSFHPSPMGVVCGERRMTWWTGNNNHFHSLGNALRMFLANKGI